MGLFDFMKRKTKQDVERIVSESLKRAMNNIPREKQTAARWEQQFMAYDNLINRNEYRNKETMETLKIIRDLNPDASMALWNFLRIGNTGHEVEAVRPDGEIDEEGTRILNEYAPNLGALYGGGTDQLINVLMLTSFTQGAVSLEVEVNEQLDGIVDFHAVDPATLDFRTNEETKTLELVQRQTDGTYKLMNPETVFYYPIDPDVSDPHGRSPILPVLQIIFFQVEVMKSLQKVIHHQGYERFDISVVEESIIENLPPHIQNGSPEEINTFVQSFVESVQSQMADLEPDDDFFHTNSVEIKTVGGTRNATVNAEAVIKVINQQVVTSLKHLPILLGRNESTTETHGTVQWQVFISGIETIRRGIKRLLERAMNVTLQIHGIQGRARVTFNELMVEDELKAAQTEETKTNTKITQVNQGWISNDQAANEMVGHNAVSDPKRDDPLAAFRPPVASRAERIAHMKAGYIVPGKIRAGYEPDPFITETGDDWAEDLGRIAEAAFQAYTAFLGSQRVLYLDRLKDAPRPPKAALERAMIAQQQRADDEEEENDVDPEFEQWVDDHILQGREEQLSLWNDLGHDWMAQAAYLTGSASLVELTTDIVFNQRDENLMRWLSNRARREAELIQGATDFDVIMTLWDVVADGKFSIPKAAEALQDSYSFSENRARVIARTEMISAGRCGQFHGDQQSGMVIGKQWKAAQQERTRKGHKKADEQIVKFDEAFSVANAKGQMEMLMFPGDDSLGASASNIIQCRCWYKRILEGEEDKLKA